MPIISSIISHKQDRGNGSLSVHEEHTDQMGVVHNRRQIRPLDHDVNAELIVHAAEVDIAIIEGDETRVRLEIEGGADPAAVVTDHLTAKQLLRQIVIAAMKMPAVDATRVAQYIDTLPDTELDRAFDSTIRQRIRARVASIISLQIPLQYDEERREELDPSRPF